MVGGKDTEDEEEEGTRMMMMMMLRLSGFNELR